MNVHRLPAYLVLLASLAASSRLAAQSDAEAAYYKACYLQGEERDFAAAATLFEEATGDASIPAELRTAATRRLAECCEELAATDLAGLMPAESIAYVQFANIGSQVKTVLESLGLAGELGEARSGERIRIEDGLSFPVDFRLSPALVREVGKLGGVAAAMTGFDASGIPQGVVVVHVGDSDLLRGLVETGMQVVTPNESIGGYATFRIPADEVSLWLVQTERLLILSPSRELAGGVVARLKQGSTTGSLKESESFRNVADARDNSLLYAWADSQRAAPLVFAAMQREMSPQEMMAAAAVLNLQQIECATLAVGATQGGLRAEAAVRFKPGHQHLVYGLLRTAPIGVDALRHVPSDAAAVAAIGLNPPASTAAASSSAAAPQIALMDIGRELFGNVRSASLFVTASDGPLPEIGVVVYAQDATKSRELWTQLMGLPARFGIVPTESASETQVNGHAATRYVYPEAPPIFVSQPSAEALVIGTEGAVGASLAAADGPGGAGGLLEHAHESTSKAVFIQFGAAARCAAAAARGPEREKIAALAPLIEKTTATLTVDEDPNELSIGIELAGVPRVADVLRAVGGAMEGTSTATSLQVNAER